MTRAAIALLVIFACGDSTGSGFDVTITLSRQTGGCPNCCAWWWSAVASDSGRAVDYTVSIGPESRTGTFTNSTFLAVPQLGTVLSVGSYDYVWHVESEGFVKDGGYSVTCP